ncbi:MAG: hypothetical protein ING10_03605 [Roseomonas sp.]|nr:hypothetical protein [Roseomonas sp.]
MSSGAYRGRQMRGSGSLLLVALLLAGCGGTSGLGGTGEGASVAPRPILDPIAAFAADPPTEAQAQIFLADQNETVTLRIMRQYAAASGRECREVRVTQRGGDSLRLFCRAGTGWIEARPLIAHTAAR